MKKYVKIKKNLSEGMSWVNSDMPQFKNKVFIAREDGKFQGCVRYSLDGIPWKWYHWMFDEITKEEYERLSCPITITSDGYTTTASYNGKSAVAKCNPSDTFDIFKGAKLALERLEAAENFKPYLKGHDDYFYGYIGEPTNIKDQLGNSLDIGDTVRLYHKTYGYLGEYSTVKREDKYCIMSMGFSEFPRNNYIIIKERSYTKVTEDKVDDTTYVTRPDQLS